MIPNGKKMDWHGHKLVFESEKDLCRGCFFEDKDECPECDEGVWVEENPSPWHTGTPTEDGLYILAYRYGCGEKIYYDVLRWEGIWKDADMGWDAQKVEDLAWQKIEPYEEDA